MSNIRKITLIMMSFTLVFTISTLVLSSDYDFVAHLSGKDAGIDTESQGQLILKFNKDYTELYYKLIVVNINNVTEAHLHGHGMDGMGEMLIATLYSGPAIDGRFDGILAEGVITKDDISCPHASPSENPFKHIAMCIGEGHIYVDVHTTQNQDGEIKGQVK